MSFFGEFKNSLKDDAGDLGGRYFAKVVAEVIKENPWFLSILHKDISTKVDIRSVEEETPFCGESGKNRRNDLEVQYTDKTNKLQKLYIEIKWKDNTHENQIRDYIAKIKDEENYKFLLLSLHKLENREKDLSLIDANKPKATSLTCPELYEKLIKHLKKNSKHNNWLIQQFIQFLKENAMIYEQNINKKALIRFMKNTIGWSHQDNFGKNLTQDVVNEYPALLHTLLSNIHKVSLEIFEKYKEDNTKSPYTDFFIQSNCSNYNKHQEGRFAVKNGADEGKFIIQSRFKTDNYLAYGIFFYVHKNKSKDKDGKNQKYIIELYTFANTYAENTSKSIGYHKTKFEKFDITVLDKDDKGKEIIKFPSCEYLFKQIQSDIEKVKK